MAYRAGRGEKDGGRISGYALDLMALGQCGRPGVEGVQWGPGGGEEPDRQPGAGLGAGARGKLPSGYKA